MKPKSTRVRVLGGVLLAALAGSGALQADNNNPSIEACAGYAEADAVYDAAMQQASEARRARWEQMKPAQQQAYDAYNAALRQASADRQQGLRAGDDFTRVSDAYDAARE